MRALLSRVARLTVVQNAIALFGARAFAFLLPLITIPYLARVLGPESWGKVVLAQALGLYLVLIIDYSFTVSATRQVARKRDDRDELARILSGVLGAKLVLIAACAVLIGILQISVPMIRDIGWFIWLALYWAVGFAVVPMFYFQGIERIPRLLKIDIPVRIVSTLAIFVVVRDPQDAWLVLFLQATGGIVIMMVALGMIYRDVPFVIPGRSETFLALREGRQLFSTKISSSLYWMSNPIILGSVAPAQFVGFYAGAERIVKALQTMAEPISQAMFPQSSSMAEQDRSKLARIVSATSAAMTVAGLLAAIVIYALAPFIIRVMLGPGYDPAVDVLRILAILLPVMGISMPLVMQWMIPLGMDRQLMWIAIGAGVFHIPLAIFLASRFQHVGVASAYAITEVGHVIALLVVLQSRRLIPFTFRWHGHSTIGAQQES